MHYSSVETQATVKGRQMGIWDLGTWADRTARDRSRRVTSIRAARKRECGLHIAELWILEFGVRKVSTLLARECRAPELTRQSWPDFAPYRVSPVAAAVNLARTSGDSVNLDNDEPILIPLSVWCQSRSLRPTVKATYRSHSPD